MVGCSCYECGAEVPKGIDSHFTAEDGRILCESCSIGVKPCTERIRNIIRKYEKLDK